MDEKDSWIKHILGTNGHDEDSPRRRDPGGGLQPLDRAIATAVIWCVSALLLLRFRNPEFGFIAGSLAVATTIFIWKKR